MNCSDFPLADMERLFKAQQQGGVSEFGTQIVNAIPSDEPEDQPNLVK